MTSESQWAERVRSARTVPWWWVLVAAVLSVALGVVAGWWTKSWRTPAVPTTTAAPPRLTALVTSGRPDDAVLAEVVAGPVAVGKVRALGRVTALPQIGTVVAEGGTVLEVDYQPVVVLSGKRPAIRDLTIGLVGPDCAQLNAALSRMKLVPRAGSDRCDADTIAGWHRLVPQSTAAASVVPLAELVFVPQLPARIGKVAAVVGDGPSDTAVELASLTPVLTVVVEAADAALLPQKAVVEIIAPSGERKPARIARRTLAPSGAVELTVTASLPSDWWGKSLRASVSPATPAGTAGMLVPRAALQARPDGTAQVQVLDANDLPRAVTVTVVAFDRTVAQVSGDLTVNDRVLIGGLG